MECKTCHDQTTAYLDEELAPATREQMDAHLQACLFCAQELRTMRAAAELVDTSLEDIEPQPIVWKNVRARILQSGAPSPAVGFWRRLTGSPWLVPATAVAASLVLAIGLWGYFQATRAEQELQAYMSEYIEHRDRGEAEHGLPVSGAGLAMPDGGVNHPEYRGNPFAPARPVSLANPFGREGR